ncbi:MAG: hypothetical protein INR70_26765 [Parafilimonas terrae]|nr:hypothetical protein [Parafilimonas terrae]
MKAEALMKAFHLALSASGGPGHVGRMQACEVTDEAGEPTGEARTLIDGYFDLQRVAHIVAQMIGKPEHQP